MKAERGDQEAAAVQAALEQLGHGAEEGAGVHLSDDGRHGAGQEHGALRRDRVPLPGAPVFGGEAAEKRMSRVDQLAHGTGLLREGAYRPEIGAEVGLDGTRDGLGGAVRREVNPAAVGEDGEGSFVQCAAFVHVRRTDGAYVWIYP